MPGTTMLQIDVDDPDDIHFLDSVGYQYVNQDDWASIQLLVYKDQKTSELGPQASMFSAARMTWPEGYGYGQPFVLGPSVGWTGGPGYATMLIGHRNKGGKWREDDRVEFEVKA